MFLIVSYCNKQTINSDNFKLSMKKFKYKYKILGNKEKWNGFMTKILAYKKYIDKIKKNVKKNITVCLIDCYDVIACRSSNDFYKLINKIGYDKSKILCSSQSECKEYNCIELKNWWKNNILKPTNYNLYVNSGFILGEVSLISHLLDWMISSKETDDQMALCKYIELYPNKIDIDITSKIISTILPRDFPDYIIYKECINKKYIMNTKTSTFPFFIHTPAITSDMMYRIDYFGNELLGNAYKKYPINERFNLLIQKIKTHKEYSIKSLILIIPLLIGSYIIMPKSRKYISYSIIIFFILLFFYLKIL